MLLGQTRPPSDVSGGRSNQCPRPPQSSVQNRIHLRRMMSLSANSWPTLTPTLSSA